MLYDLINISDRYTFHADSLECAAALTLLLGNGQYGATPLGSEPTDGVPIFIIAHPEPWFQEKFGRSVTASLRAFTAGDERAALITALRSVLIGDRVEYETTLPLIIETERTAWTRAWKDRHRSSMNDIGRRAEQWANKLESLEDGGVKVDSVPRQVFGL